MSSHYANLDKSRRLKALRQHFVDHRITTPREIIAATGTTNPSRDVDELRKNGVNIPGAKYRGMSENGRRVYEYNTTTIEI